MSPQISQDLRAVNLPITNRAADEIDRLHHAVKMAERHFARNGYKADHPARRILNAALTPQSDAG